MAAHDDKLIDPLALVAIARAAHRTGERALERRARQLLKENHGIVLTFSRAHEAQEVRGRD